MSNKKTKKSRAVIGRRFTTVNIEDSINSSDERVFKLRSGKEASFSVVRFTYEQLVADTFVATEVNGREQNALSVEGVEEIRRTLQINQFFPCIGRVINNKTEFLDGSRRRFCAIHDKHGLFALVTKDEISTADAKGLAADIQTSLEHNLREQGLPLLEFEAKGLSQRQIAEETGLSQSKVSRAIQAASVPADMLRVFTIRNELGYSDYKALLNISASFESKNIDLNELISSVSESAANLDSKMASDELKREIMSLYKVHSDIHLNNEKSKKIEKATVSKLRTFNDSGMHAKKKIQGRQVSFDFSKISQSAINDIEIAIQEQLDKHYPDK